MKSDVITDRKVFHTVIKPVGDDHKPGKFIQITCKKCGAIGEASIRGHVKLISHEAGGQLFRKQGWKMGTTRTKDLCPDCAHPAPKPAKAPVKIVVHRIPPEPVPALIDGKPVTPPEHVWSIWPETDGQEQRCSICKAFRRTPEEDKTWLKTPAREQIVKVIERTIEIVKEDRPMAVEAPREPTRDENRLIRDKLFDTYDEDKQCYKGDWTDQTVAEALAKPWAWVTKVREQFFGPECNEQEELSRKEIAAIWQEANALETKLTKVFGEFADQLSALNARLSKAEAKLPKKAV